MEIISYGAAMVLLHFLIQTAFIVRVLIRPHRQPASRLAWVVVILALPVFGILVYILFGEINIGRQRIAKLRNIVECMPDFPDAIQKHQENLKANIPIEYQHLFRVAESINHFNPVGGNTARLMADSNTAIDSMVADIDAAEHHVHLLFYIWLPDGNGCKIVEALKRAAGRGVICRAMADDLGSRTMIHSVHWQAMKDAGIRLAEALPIGSPLLRPFTGRIDLRNHRKIVVIDHNITYCGSQNCADPEFLVKAKYAPWVDILLRFEGPVATQNQFLFASDWMLNSGENLNELLQQPVSASNSGFPAQVIGTGPTARYSAMPEMFESLMYTAKHQLIISTPYYVPDESMQNALCSAAYRGVNTTIIFPARNDSWMVGAASRSYYAELLAAGVKIYEYESGLLHSKTLTLDGEITLIGSANMDRRSFELNYENNILLYDSTLTAEIRQRQMEYILQSTFIKQDAVTKWSMLSTLKNNAIAMLGPLF
ncbi:MAG: cardiolipin synthase [Gammaproteobacteria bacterium]|nr:cardiolipin synthase [Gammaproteobacteria bacterium]